MTCKLIYETTIPSIFLRVFTLLRLREMEAILQELKNTLSSRDTENILNQSPNNKSWNFIIVTPKSTGPEVSNL